jgi:hypothetical protein
VKPNRYESRGNMGKCQLIRDPLERVGLAFTDLPRSWLGSDAACAMVVRPDGAGPDLAHSACDYRRAASPCENRPSRDRDCLI